MTAYTYRKKYRGEEVLIAGNRVLKTINEAQQQHGGPPTVGLCDTLLDDAEKNNWIIFVKVKYPEVEFSTTAKEWKKRAKKEPHIIYYPNNPFYIYRAAIPKEAFEHKVDLFPSPAQKEIEEKREYYRAFC